MPNATIAQYPIEHPDLLVSNILARLEMRSIVVEHRPELGMTRASADDRCAVMEFDEGNALASGVEDMLERFDLAVAQGAPELHSVRAA